MKIKRLVCLVLSCLMAAVMVNASASETYKTTARVNFRTGPSLDAAVIKTVELGASVEVVEYDADNWSKVVYNNTTGYMKSEYLVPAYDVIPVSAVPLAEGIGDEDAAPEIYKTTTRVNLRTGPSTDDTLIKTLDMGTELKMLAYDADNWSKVVYNNTTGYIKSEYIVSASQYEEAIALKAGDVELLEWQAVKSILPLYRPLQITDVRTGAVYYVQSFSNGKHADVEPLTKADTATLLNTFGGKWQWTPRAVWVTFNGRTFAASINGMPHGGGTISGNGMNGQICLHFLGSKTHNGTTSHERDHQARVMEAFNAAK